MCHLDKAEARSLLHVEVYACWPSRKRFDDVLNVISLVSNCCVRVNASTRNSVTNILVWSVSLGWLVQGEYSCDVLVTRLHQTGLKMRSHTSTDTPMSAPTRWLCVVHIPMTHMPTHQQYLRDTRMSRRSKTMKSLHGLIFTQHQLSLTSWLSF